MFELAEVLPKINPDVETFPVPEMTKAPPMLVATAALAANVILVFEVKLPELTVKVPARFALPTEALFTVRLPPLTVALAYETAPMVRAPATLTLPPLTVRPPVVLAVEPLWRGILMLDAVIVPPDTV